MVWIIYANVTWHSVFDQCFLELHLYDTSLICLFEFFPSYKILNNVVFM